MAGLLHEFFPIPLLIEVLRQHAPQAEGFEEGLAADVAFVAGGLEGLKANLVLLLHLEGLDQLDASAFGAQTHPFSGDAQGLGHGVLEHAHHRCEVAGGFGTVQGAGGSGRAPGALLQELRPVARHLRLQVVQVIASGLDRGPGVLHVVEPALGVRIVQHLVRPNHHRVRVLPGRPGARQQREAGDGEDVTLVGGRLPVSHVEVSQVPQRGLPVHEAVPLGVERDQRDVRQAGCPLIDHGPGFLPVLGLHHFPKLYNSGLHDPDALLLHLRETVLLRVRLHDANVLEDFDTVDHLRTGKQHALRLDHHPVRAQAFPAVIRQRARGSAFDRGGAGEVDEDVGEGFGHALPEPTAAEHRDVVAL